MPAPDLRVSAFSNQNWAMSFGHTNGSFTIANDGDAPSAATTVDVMLGMLGLQTLTIPAIGAGSSYSAGFSQPMTFTGSGALTLKADAANLNAEPNEGNNLSGAQPFTSVHHGVVVPGGFDYTYYLSQNPDVAAAGVDAFQHYNQFGWHEGRNPNALFDTNYYLAHNWDIYVAGVNPLTHYEQSGWHEGRDPGPHFNTSMYLAVYNDVAAAGVNPMDHFYNSGLYEGRENFWPV